MTSETLCSCKIVWPSVNTPDVVDTADSQTLSEEGELRLQVLAELDAFVRCLDDICLAQELVRDELPWTQQRLPV